jgi:hypothetical protein
MPARPVQSDPAMNRDDVSMSHSRTRGAQSARAQNLRRGMKVADAVFYALYVPILAVLALDLAGADPRSPFVRFMGTVAAPFLAPFESLISSREFAEFRVVGACIAVLLAFFLVHQLIKSALDLAASNPSES